MEKERKIQIQLKENMVKYNLQTMFDIAKKYFAKEYGYTGTEIKLSNLYQNSINSYIGFWKIRDIRRVVLICFVLNE